MVYTKNRKTQLIYSLESNVEIILRILFLEPTLRIRQFCGTGIVQEITIDVQARLSNSS